MEKKNCKKCGKTWIIEKFDAHLCIEIPPKPRKARIIAPKAEKATTPKKTKRSRTASTDPIVAE